MKFVVNSFLFITVFASFIYASSMTSSTGMPIGKIVYARDVTYSNQAFYIVFSGDPEDQAHEYWFEVGNNALTLEDFNNVYAAALTAKATGNLIQLSYDFIGGFNYCRPFIRIVQ